MTTAREPDSGKTNALCSRDVARAKEMFLDLYPFLKRKQEHDYLSHAIIKGSPRKS
jgi:hypothetical protein